MGKRFKCNTSLRICAWQLEIDNFNILEIVHTIEYHILCELEVFERWQEIKSLNMYIVTGQPPGKFLRSDHVPGKFSEASQIRNVKPCELFETSVTSCYTNSLKGKVAQSQFTHRLIGSGHSIPRHIYRLTEIKLRWKHTRLLHLALHGKDKALVRGFCDIRCIYVHHRHGQCVVCNAP